MGLEQQLPLWQPLSKNIYQLPLLTRQHQRLQELKTQSLDQQPALACSQLSDAFLVKQLDQFIKFYDKPLKEVTKALKTLIQQDEPLRLKGECLCTIKGLGLLSVATLPKRPLATVREGMGAIRMPLARDWGSFRAH